MCVCLHLVGNKVYNDVEWQLWGRDHLEIVASFLMRQLLIFDL